MRIQIGNRYRPFSHQPGTTCLLPGTNLVVQAFPTLIKLLGVTEIPLDVQGPVKDFTVRQDLERGQIEVWGCGKSGYMHFTLRHLEGEVSLKSRGSSR